MRGLCLAIIAQLGVLAGCSFTRQLPGARPNAMYLRHTARQLIAHYRLGLPVTDQLENLMDAQARRDELFAFGKSRGRHLDTHPLLLTAAARILRHTPRDRRVANFFGRRRSLSWPRLAADSTCSLNCLRVLWSRQPLCSDPACIHPAIRQTLCSHSQGIVWSSSSLSFPGVRLAFSENTICLTPGHARRSFGLCRERFLGHCAALSASIAALHSSPGSYGCSTACSDS